MIFLSSVRVATIEVCVSKGDRERERVRESVDYFIYCAEFCVCDFCTDFQMKFGFSTLGRTGQTTTYRAERESEEKTITKTRINSTAQVLQS